MVDNGKSWLKMALPNLPLRNKREPSVGMFRVGTGSYMFIVDNNIFLRMVENRIDD